MAEVQQPTLDLPIREPVMVNLYLGEEYRKGGFLARRLGMGKKAVRMLNDESCGISWKRVRVSSEDITTENFTDPDLRYALRFAAAAKALGMIPDSETLSHSNSVWVIATDGGKDSRLLSADYSGNDEHPFLKDFVDFSK